VVRCSSWTMPMTLTRELRPLHYLSRAAVGERF
jgi:hypothetical protein